MIKKSLFAILKNYGILLILTFIFRVVFYLYNKDAFALSAEEVGASFLYGLRFDFAAVSMLFSLFLISLFFPIKKIHLIVYLGISAVMTYLYLVDIEYYQFVGKRLRLDVFGEGGDFLGQMVQITLYYWPLAIVFFGTLYLLYKFYHHIQERSLKFSFMLISLLAINFIAIRGGLQLKSISPQNAFAKGNHKQGVLTLNPVYTFFRTLNDKRVKKVSFFTKEEEVFSLLREKKKSILKENFLKQNIVIIILESFASEYLNYAPFLQTLMKKGLSFDRALANGRRSMEAMPSIFQSFPAVLNEPIYKSSYQTNQAETLARTLNQAGYTSAFFHGGKLGTMGFDHYSLSSGFQRYFSKNDYPIETHYDGHWGIFDHYFFQFYKEEMDKLKEPFLTSFFSLSSHHPYRLPESLKKNFKEGPLPIHKTISYGDFSLKNFFKNAQESSWFKNTLFVITADHSQKRITKKYQNIVGEYRVPLLFYHPSIDLRKYTQDKVVSHVDIFPSILDFLGIKAEKKSLYGDSIFREGPGEVLFKSGDVFFLLKENKLASMSLQGRGRVQNYDFKTGHLSSGEPEPKLLNKLKAYIQYTNNGLQKDQLYLPNP